MAEDSPDFDTWETLLRAHAVLVPRVAADVERVTGVPLSWYDVLLELARAPNRRLRMSDLGEQVVLSRSRVSRIVDELVDAGLAEKQPDPGDGRATLARLTRRGVTVLRRVQPVYLAAVEQRFDAHLTPDERAVIARGLGRLVEPDDSRGDVSDLLQ